VIACSPLRAWRGAQNPSVIRAWPTPTGCHLPATVAAGLREVVAASGLALISDSCGLTENSEHVFLTNVESFSGWVNP
jgi:hypothetical protein